MDVVQESNRPWLYGKLVNRLDETVVLYYLTTMPRKRKHYTVYKKLQSTFFKSEEAFVLCGEVQHHVCI